MSFSAPILRAAPHSGTSRLVRASLLGFTALIAFPVFGAQAATTHHGHTQRARPGHGSVTEPATPPEDAILGTINGQVLTERDVDNRGKLFALSTGLNISLISCSVCARRSFAS